MARFPRAEAEIIALANSIITGLTAHPDEFPSPPIKPEDLKAKLDKYHIKCDNVVSTQKIADETFIDKNNFVQEICDDMRQEIQYAEHTTSKDKLPLIGWDVRAERVALQTPGQVRNLVCAERGIDWLTLEWNSPADGGKVAAYQIQQCELPDGEWIFITNAFEKEITLNNLTRGKSYEFRIEAANKEGVGPVSNSFTITF